MKRYGVFTAALVCTMLVALAAQAQPQGGGRGGRGGRGGGMGGFGMMGGGMGLVALCANSRCPGRPATDPRPKGQVEGSGGSTARRHARRGRHARPFARRAPGQDAGENGSYSEAARRNPQAGPTPTIGRNSGCKSAAQSALVTPEMVKALTLTPEQTEKIRGVQQQVQEKMRDSFSGLRDMSQEEQPYEDDGTDENGAERIIRKGRGSPYPAAAGDPGKAEGQEVGHRASDAWPAATGRLGRG